MLARADSPPAPPSLRALRTPTPLQGVKKVRVFKKFTYRGVDLEKLLTMKPANYIELLPARLRRRFTRGLTRKHTNLLQKLRKAKKEAKVAPGETTARPPTIKVRPGRVRRARTTHRPSLTPPPPSPPRSTPADAPAQHAHLA